MEFLLVSTLDYVVALQVAVLYYYFMLFKLSIGLLRRFSKFYAASLKRETLLGKGRLRANIYEDARTKINRETKLRFWGSFAGVESMMKTCYRIPSTLSGFYGRSGLEFIVGWKEHNTQP